jgi:hypothetical protein
LESHPESCEVTDWQPKSLLWRNGTLKRWIRMINMASEGILLRFLINEVIERPTSSWASNQALRDTLSVLKQLGVAGSLSLPPREDIRIDDTHARLLAKAIR